MKCPECNSIIVLNKGDYIKENIFIHSFDCAKCGIRLANSIRGEILRLAGYIVLTIGIMAFIGSWPIPLLDPVVSGVILTTGLALLIYGQRVVSVACNYKNT